MSLQVRSGSVIAPDKEVRTVQQMAVLRSDQRNQSFWDLEVTHMTPRDMRIHKPILVFLLICTFRRKMDGKAAQTKSVTMDKTARDSQ